MLRIMTLYISSKISNICTIPIILSTHGVIVDIRYIPVAFVDGYDTYHVDNVALNSFWAPLGFILFAHKGCILA